MASAENVAGVPAVRGEVLHQRPDVAAALAQRRHMDMNDAQPVEEILAELAGGHALAQVPVRRGDDADVDVAGAVGGADALQLALLEESQQQRLHAQAHLAHFVEEQRAAVGHLQLAELVAIGAGEAALHVAEQLRFQQRFGEAGAIDGHERAVGAQRVRVDLARDEILADAAFTGDQDLGVADRGALREPQHFGELRTASDNRIHGSG